MPQLVDLSPSARDELVSRLPRVPEARPLIDALLAPHADLASLAMDRRRLAVTAESYAELRQPVADALDFICLFETDAKVQATIDHVVGGLDLMAETAREADLADVAPATAAEVKSVMPLMGASGIEAWAIHLEAPLPVNYYPGQVVPVLRQSAVRRALDVQAGHTDEGLANGYLGPSGAQAPLPEPADPEWDQLAPALPPNEFGQLVFFLPVVFSRVRWDGPPAVGEYWTLGHPSGERITLAPPMVNPLTMGQLAGAAGASGAPETLRLRATGTDLARVRAAVFAGVGKPQGRAKQVELLVDAVGANEPGLRALAEAADWLTLTRVQ